MVNQENVKRVLSELEGEITCIEEYDEYLEAMDLLENLKEILQMN